EARLLLRRLDRLFQSRDDLLRDGPLLEKSRLGRDGEEVLRETVMDLARDAGPLLGDCPSELGGSDRPPDADQQDAVGEQPQEVALRDERTREERREDVVQLGKEPKRGGEGEPTVEILPVRAVAQAESDERDKAEHRLQG